MNFEEWKKVDKNWALVDSDINAKEIWSAAIEEAVKIASEMADEYKDLGAAHGGAEIAKAIKELKQ